MSRRRKVQIEPPSITKHIARTLERYPDGGQILKELIQNADDAEATEVKFVLDSSHYPTDHLIHPNLSGFQGPALYAWNNAVFKEEDWEHFGKMEDSSKEKDALKVGRFGVGFLSVFHITDLPILISTDSAAMLDPHSKFTGTNKPGWDDSLENFLSYRGHAACFQSISPCSIQPNTQYYPATLFRFPLRLPNAKSEITSSSYSVERVQDFLFKSFIEEAPIILLFLKYVEEISLYDGDSLVYKVSIHPSHKLKVRSERKELIQLGLSKPTYPSLRLYSMTICVDDICKNCMNDAYHWLVFNMIGSTIHTIQELSQKLLILPWVGVAAPLPNMISLKGVHLDKLDINQLSKVLHMIQSKLSGRVTSLPWCDEVQGHTRGHAFCFLPLPNTTHLPINIHGYFAVSDNRRTIEWPASDNKSDKALWNQELVLKQVAPLYSILISFRSKLIDYQNTPLPICGIDTGMTDPYAAWPLCSEVRHKEIWNELVQPTVVGCIDSPVFWSAIGKWVTISEAVFMPQKKEFPFPRKAVEVLVQARVPIVSLPDKLCHTLQECLQNQTIGTTVTQTHIRKAMKKIRMSYTDYQELEEVLICVLQDITRKNFSELFGLNILPLATERFTVKTIEPSKNVSEDEFVYFTDRKMADIVKLLPGAESSIVSVLTIDSDVILSKFQDIASWNVSQIRLLFPKIVCQKLLPRSIYSWSRCKRGQHIVWNKNSCDFPLVNWIREIWNWLYNNPEVIAELTGLSILPKELVDDNISTCTLLPFPHTSAKYYFKDNTEDKLTTLFAKLGATIVEKNDIVCSNRRISDHIADVSIPNLIIYLMSRMPALKSLTKADVDELRVLIAKYYYGKHLSNEFRKFLYELPIYELGVGRTAHKLSSLDTCILPPSHMSFDGLLLYPSNILNNSDSIVHRFISENLQFRACAIDDVYLAIVRFAMAQLSNSSAWNNGDELIAWVMKECSHLSSKLVSFFRDQPFVRLRANCRCFKRPQELYNPDDKQFCKLFELENDQVFPADNYKNKDVLGVLIKLGLKKWTDIENDLSVFCDFLYERTVCVKNLSNHPAAFERSLYILELICSYPSHSYKLLHHIRAVDFLCVQVSPPSTFPSILPWYGRQVQKKLEAPMRLCYSMNSANLIGSVSSIIDMKYKERLNFQLSERTAGNFFEPSVENVMKQLNILTVQCAKKQVTQADIESISKMVDKIYGFLNVHVSSLSQSSFPRQWIWWRHDQGEYKFMASNLFTITSPFDLSPFMYHIEAEPNYFKFKRLFKVSGVKSDPTSADLIRVLQCINSSIPTPLDEKFIKMSISIISMLHEKHYENTGELLLPTTDCALRAVSKCTYDDREWISKKFGKVLKKYSFLHKGITPEIAEYFDVQPLSRKVAPSSGLKLRYKQIGQKEPLTRRISGIVNDYSGNIDVFKELIQNADDAKASEIKLLLDWRHHGKESLFEKEMRHWQGPALIAYNNATFSDQDFQNICLLAGETKMSDPLKTGRFGVGFCSCYSLTDVPSFLSRRFLTIFDPHTLYLGTRVSHNEPGMQIDIIEETDGVEVYEDQFAPFNGVFGCNLGNLGENGFEGTLFRFPLRMKGCPYSEITNDLYDRSRMSKRINNLQDEAQKLLIFLKYIQSLEVFELEQNAQSTVEMKLLFRVSKTPSSSIQSRVKYIQDYIEDPYDLDGPICTKCTISVDIPSVKEVIPSHQYLISSALSPASYAEGKGMLPLAEIAIKVTENCNPILEKDGQLFCFLPLPLKHSLPFFINGYFNIGKDRRGLKEAEDSKEYQWNKMLIENILPLAFESLLQRITELVLPSNLSSSCKKEFLESYYSLWPDKSVAKGWVAEIFSEMVEKQLLKTKCCLLWTECKGGKWIELSHSCLLKRSKIPAIPQDIINSAVDTLISNGITVVECPKHVFKLIVNIVENFKNLFDYQRFFTEIFIAKIESLADSIQDIHLKFVLEKIEQSYLTNLYQWAVDLLKKSKCIPVAESDTLVYPRDLIDVHCTPISNLYRVHDHRFPKESFRTEACTKALITLGMISKELPESELAKRASIVCELDENESHEHMVKILDYISYIEHEEGSYHYQYGGMFRYSKKSNRQKRIDALFKIRFLKAQSKQEKLFIPWYDVSEQYYCPLDLFPSIYSKLIFNQKPVVLFTRNEDDFEQYLGIESKCISVEDVIQNMLVLIEHLVEVDVCNDATHEFVDESFNSMYEFLNSRCTGNRKFIKEKLREKQCIWQDQRLHYPSQLLFHWEKTPFYPYICPMSTTNKQYEELFDCLGIEREASYYHLCTVLSRVKSDYEDDPLPDGLLELVHDIAIKLYQKKKGGDNFKEIEVFLPDNDKVLRSTSSLCCDSNLKSEWIEGLEVYSEFKEKGGHFVNSLISREIALELGAYAIIDAVLKDIEDEEFYSFGQHEDLVDRLNGILKKYPADDSIFREFIQNADDAKASEIVFILDNRTDYPNQRLVSENSKWKELQATPALCIFNDRPFSEEDIQNICKLGRGGKGETADTIGRFGIGFNVAYHLTDCPMFVSFDEAGSPQNFCVFDPLMRYCPKANWKRPGRRWRSAVSGTLEQFSDQFKPFLKDMFDSIKSVVPCFNDLSKGFTMFRLPLIHYEPPRHYYLYPKSSSQTDDRYFKEANVHSASKVKQLIEILKSYSENMVLFLNNLLSISVFEITSDGNIIHNFSSTKAVHSTDNSRITEITLTHEKNAGSVQSKWLKSSCSGISVADADVIEMLDIASSRGLEPSGASAILLGRKKHLEGLLFCFLPVNIPSCLPVHFNAHFLIDDSRCHLSKLQGLEKWNQTISEHVLVPSYLELILNARENVDGSKESICWFYSLFPNLENYSQQSEASTLNISMLFYEKLIADNLPVLFDLRAASADDNTAGVNWLTINSGNIGLFSSTYFKKIPFISKMGVGQILADVNMPITCAPDFVFNSLCKASEIYADGRIGLVTPDKVLNHLRTTTFSEQQVEIIKANCENLLKFCLQIYVSHGSRVNLQPILAGAPLLLTMEDTLDSSGSLCESKYSSILPHVGENFIKPALEYSDVGKTLRDGGAIVTLPAHFVAQNIELSDCTEPTELEHDQVKLVGTLWQYLSSEICLLINVVTQYFNHKPIIPSSNGTFYPPVLSKCVFIKSDVDECISSAIEKLGYHTAYFIKIGFISVPSVVQSILSDTTKPNDLIQCMKLCPPADVEEFTSSEADRLISLLSLYSGSFPLEISQILKRLPLFRTIDGLYHRLSEAKKFYVMPINVSRDGLHTIQRHTKQLILDVSSSTEQFYTKLISENEYSLAKPSDKKFYIELILPHLECLNHKDMLVHLRVVRHWLLESHYISLSKDEREGIIKILQTKAFISKDGKNYRASDLYDPKVTFHATFNKTKLPPEEWDGDWLLFLRLLGLQTDVDNNSWLIKAKKVAEEGNRDLQNPSEDLIKKSEALLDTLKGKIAFHNQKIKLPGAQAIDITFHDFLNSVSTIRFVYSGEPSDTEKHLRTIADQSPIDHKPFVIFHEAVFNEHENLAVLCRTVLPASCDFIKFFDCVFRDSLSIRQLTVKTVVRNLITLSNLLCCDRVQAFVPSDKKIKAICEIKKIFDEHYDYLDDKYEQKSAFSDLKTARCILLVQNMYSFNLVRPSQLVINLPSDLDLRPFCYKVPTELLKYVKLLHIIGVQDDVDPIMCLGIMSNIKREMDRANKRLNQDDHYLNVCKSAFEISIVMFRKQPHISVPKDMEVYLPSDEYELKKPNDLVCNDVPWIQDRLQHTQNMKYKFLYPPPPDGKGQRIPPPCLGIKLLSDIATEELHCDVLDSLNRCNDEVRFEQGTRTKNCQMIEVMTETFRSKEFMIGFARLYWHDHKKSPLSDKTFCFKLKNVKEMSLTCVKSIKTVVKLNGSIAPGTEDDAYFCYLKNDTDGNLKLYLLHMPKSVEDFLEQLAAILNKYLGRCIANENPIKAMLRCHPRDITGALNKLHISPYDPKRVEVKPDHMEVGAEIHFNELDKEDMLLFCNYEDGEKVIFHSMANGKESYKIARIVKCPLKPAINLKEKFVQLFTESDKKGPKTISVPLVQVHKILNTSQRQMIITEQSTQFSNPLIISPLPDCEDKLLTWITQTLDYNAEHLCCSVLQLCKRILAHMHYLFVKKDDLTVLFLIAAKHLLHHAQRLMGTRSSSYITQTIIYFVRRMEKLSLDSDDVFGIPAAPERIESRSGNFSVFSGGSSNYGNYRYTSGQPRFGFLNTGTNRFVPFTPPVRQPQVVPDERKAKVWLHQAKADYLAACDIYKKLHKEADDSKGTMRDECKYPALVCFLCHDIVEKSMKGVLYKKYGLREYLVECRDLTALITELRDSRSCEDLKQVIISCASLVIVHGNMSRYPNYHHPACTPASMYTFGQAVEALKSVSNLMEALHQDPDLNLILGDLQTIEQDHFTTLSRCFENNEDYPNNWTFHDDGNFSLVLLDNDAEDGDMEEEYRAVSSLFESTLSPWHYEIERIDRIQNKLLWRRYFDCAKRMMEFNEGVLNETHLFHGTRTNKPEEIFQGDAGFDMRFSNQGMWGKGNYFAVNASYSDGYSHRCAGNRRQMLMAYVLVGHEYNCTPNSSLTKPPSRDTSGDLKRRFDCVSGMAANSKVYITYENDRAYPAYLITYKPKD